MSREKLRPRGPGGVPAATPPGLSIDIGRALATVVETLEGNILDEDSSPAFVGLLWDLVAGLSVAVDARRLTPPLSGPAERHRTVAALDHRRARRAAAPGMAGHPAGSARTAGPKRRGAQA